MGQFSWKCAVSGDALIEKWSPVKDEAEHSAYLVTPNGTYFEECYEGYGVFGGQDVYALMGDGDRGEGIELYFEGDAPWDIKIVLADKYTGQTYDELPASEDDPNQGWESSRLPRCGDCEHTEENCECESCDNCGEKIDNCHCSECPNCWNLEENCECEEE